MAIHHSPLFAGFRGSINKQLLFRQRGGQTVVSKFPDRSKVVYSQQQIRAQKRFAQAVDFARVVIKEPGIRQIYSLKASLMGFRSAWNLAIAEFMSDKPLCAKKKKVRFNKKWLNNTMGWNVNAKLYSFSEDVLQPILQVPLRIRSRPKQEISTHSRIRLGKPTQLVDTSYSTFLFSPE